MLLVLAAKLANALGHHPLQGGYYSGSLDIGQPCLVYQMFAKNILMMIQQFTTGKQPVPGWQMFLHPTRITLPLHV